MKVNNINAKDFLESLEVVGNAIPSKTTIPSLIGVLMKFKDNKIILLGSDNSTSIKKVISPTNDSQFEILEEGSCLVDYKTLKLIVSKLDCDFTSFYTTSNQFIILDGKNVYKLNMLNIDEYPNIEFKKLENEITISTLDLKNIINNTTFACANNSTRPILTGVNFNCVNEKLNIVATDSFRLSNNKVLVNNKDNSSFSFTIPKTSLLALEKIISKTKQNIINLLYDDKNNILINVDNTLFKTRFLDGTYPDFTKVLALQQQTSNICKVDREKLINSIDRISVLATKDKDNNYSIVKLAFKQGCLEILSNNSQIGNAKNVIECDCNFDLEINCSSTFLLEALSVFESKIINIETIGELKPFFIKEDENDNIIELLLPVKS